MSRRTEIQVGITVLVALGVTLWAVTWLKELSLSRKVKVWHVTFSQAGGLASSDDVQVNGLRKGTVKRVELVLDHVAVDLELSSEITLTRDSKVAIRNVGMMGDKVVAVELRTTGMAYTERDTIVGVYEKGIPEVMTEMASTVDAVSSLAQQLDSVATMLRKDGGLKETLTNFRETSDELQLAVSENRVMLTETLRNLNAASRTAKALTTDRETQVKHTLDSFERSATGLDRLTTRLDSLRGVIQSVSSKVERGDGALGKLVNDPRLYDDARESVDELKGLIADIKKNPKKYMHLSIF